MYIYIAIYICVCVCVCGEGNAGEGVNVCVLPAALLIYVLYIEVFNRFNEFENVPF